MKNVIILGGVFLLFIPLFLSGKELESAKAAYGKIDTELNKVWSKLKDSLYETELDELQKKQRNWLEYRNYMAEHAARNTLLDSDADLEQSADYWETMTYITEARVEVLKALLNKPDDLVWEGVWRDSYGGLLLIQKPDDDQKIPFLLECVRGPTFHLGELDGIAQTNGRMARFSTQAFEDEEKQTWITFLLKQGELEVIGENTHFFHGARAHFDGHYYRIGALTPKWKEHLDKARATEDP